MLGTIGSVKTLLNFSKKNKASFLSIEFYLKSYVSLTLNTLLLINWTQICVEDDNVVMNNEKFSNESMLDRFIRPWWV